jgi:hypothetical protein
VPDGDHHANFGDSTTQSMVEALRTAIEVLRLGDHRPDLAVLATRVVERETERLKAVALNAFRS